MSTYTLTDVNLANMAIALLGNTAPVTSVTADTSPAGVQIALWYEPTRRQVLASHDWNFAHARVTLGKSELVAPSEIATGDQIASIDTESPEIEGRWAFRWRYPRMCLKVRAIQDPSKNNTNDPPPYEVRTASLLDTVNAVKITAITKASPGVVSTDTAHGLVVGDTLYIDGIKKAADAEDLTDMEEVDGRFYDVGAATGTATFTLTDMVSGASIDTTNYTTYNGTEDNGRVYKLLDGVKSILTNFDSPVAIYTKYVTDPELYSPEFIEAFTEALANKMVMPITGDLKLRREIERTKQLDTQVNITRDAQEGQGEPPRDAEWIRGR